LVLEYINAPTMEEAAFEPSERLKEWDAARVQRYQHLVSMRTALSASSCYRQLRATLKAMYAFNRCCVMHGDVAQRNFLVQEDGEKTTAVIIDLGEATLTCSSADASSDMAEVHSFFAQWRLDRRWRAEVADGLRFKIPGANWEPTGPVPQGDGSVFVRG
jgi:Ser/Thr protein kinase RdoA (MazF antagonist)